jgi:hypothetical protein
MWSVARSRTRCVVTKPRLSYRCYPLRVAQVPGALTDHGGRVGRVERMRVSRRGVYAVGRVGVWSWSGKRVATIPGCGSDGVSSNAGAPASPPRALAPRPAAPYNVGSAGKLRLVGICLHASTYTGQPILPSAGVLSHRARLCTLLSSPSWQPERLVIPCCLRPRCARVSSVVTPSNLAAATPICSIHLVIPSLPKGIRVRLLVLFTPACHTPSHDLGAGTRRPCCWVALRGDPNSQ